MGSRLGRRVIHFANLPIKLLMPSPPFDSIREIALKTIPSATKIEIRRVLESLYGFEVDEVRTLNMEGKKKKRGPFLAAKPDYKKAYVTLRSPLSIDPNLFPIPNVQEEREKIAAAQAAKRPGNVVEDDGKIVSHWLDDRAEDRKATGRGGYRRDGGGRGGGGGQRKSNKKVVKEESRFPWSSMRLWK